MSVSDHVKEAGTMHPKKMKNVCGHSLEQVRVLGEGGQASVSLCRDTHTGKLLALKTAHKEIHSKEDGEEAMEEETRFDIRMEFDIVKFLVESNVPGIVPAHGMGRDGSTGDLCILMDYCDGGTLLSELRRRPFRRLSERRAALVLSSLAQTLEHCHRLGIMHRDVKLENVLIHHGHAKDDESLNIDKRRPLRTSKTMHDKDEEEDEYLNGCRFLLADFGLACRFTPGHPIYDGCLVGTSEYIAPEMIKGAYDERADVWSLGVLLHLILTGHFPFHDLKQQHERRCSSLVLARTSACPHKLEMDSSPMYKHLSRGARALIQGMLRKDPSRRFSLSAVRSHPWLQSSSTANINITKRSGATGAIEPTSFTGAKRIRFVTHTGPDIVRHLLPPAASSSQESGTDSVLTSVFELKSLMGVKRIRFITHAVPDIVRELQTPPASSSHDDVIDDCDTNVIKPISMVGVKRIRFINHNGPDVVRDLHTSKPKKIDDGRASRQQPVQGFPTYLQRIQVPRRPRQHRARHVHPYYKELNPPILLQAAF